MATVPFQTSPQQELAVGSEVQFGATSVNPQRDVVSDDIARQGQALSNLGGVLNKLDNELNDAESKQLANNYYADAEAIKDQYNDLKGVNAVGSVTVDGKQVRVFDQYQNEMKKLLESYQTKASNGVVKYIFENKAQVYTKSFLSDMTTHSLKQQNAYNLKETEAEKDKYLRHAIIHYQDYNDPEGQFNKYRKAAENALIQEAILRGWNLDPNAVDAEGNKLGISEQYLNAKSKLQLDIVEAVTKAYKEKGDTDGARKFIESLSPFVDQKTAQTVSEKVEKDHTELISDEKVKQAIANDGNQNNGDLLTQISVLNSLSSNQSFDDGLGGVVSFGLHSNEVDITNKKLSEKIELLQQKRDASIFYNQESAKKGSLLPQHQPTHLYAVLHLGAKKADSLYLKAKKEYESSIVVPQNKRRNKKNYIKNYINNPENFVKVNTGILNNYNDLIASEYGNKVFKFYGATKDTYLNAPKRSDFGTGSDEAKKYREARKEFFSNPENIVKVNPGVDPENLEAMTGTQDEKGRSATKRFKKEKLEKATLYENKIANDLEVINNNVDYNYTPLSEEAKKIDKKIGLQPKAVIANKLKATTLNEKELKYELNQLDIIYDQIKEERLQAYKTAFNTAQEIASENGYKNLAINGINIEDFTPEDQAILKKGPPKESNIETQATLDNDPQEVRDNLDDHRFKLSKTDYLSLKGLSEELKSSETKYKEATGDVSLLKDVMYKSGYDWVYNKLKGENAATFHGIKVEWIDRIDYVQKDKKIKLGRVEKEQLLRNVLLDKVTLDQFIGSKKNVFASSVTEDQLSNQFVLVNGERIFSNNIDRFVRQKITRLLYLEKLPMNEQNIANKWVNEFNKPKTLKELNAILKK